VPDAPGTEAVAFLAVAALRPALEAMFTPVRGHLADASEEGYAIAACRQCQAYVKDIDRRVRWNGGPPLVEDWGSPHLDLIARRHGYWRPDAPVVLRATGERSA
jgi:hypothetical protein